MVMDSFSDRNHDPLLFMNVDKNELDAFLLNTSTDMSRLAEEMHMNVSDVKLENSLDLDSLEGNGHLGDMHWLHNSSLSTLAHLDNEDTSDELVSVNPQSVFPVLLIQNDHANEATVDNVNHATMRLHTHHSTINTKEPEPQILQQTPINIRQESQTIRILSVQGSQVYPPNFLVASSTDSPHKTFVLSTVDGKFPTGITISSADLPLRTHASGPRLVVASPQKIQAVKTDKGGKVLLKSGNTLLSPSQASPVLLGRLQTGIQSQQHAGRPATAKNSVPSGTTLMHLSESTTTAVSSTTSSEEKSYPKPVFSYSCLIALALKNSKNGSLPVSEIYTFMCENFPYFKTAPDGWKNSVRHNLSLNKCFAKVENPKLNHGAKKGCLWALNPAKISKMEDEISKWSKKDPIGLLSSMAYPENLEAIEKGQAGLPHSKKLPDSECTQNQNRFDISAIKTEHGDNDQVVNFFNLASNKYEDKSPGEGTELKYSIKMEYSPIADRASSPHIKQEPPSPTSKDHSHFKLESNDFSSLELPASFTNDVIADVLQSSLWDEDLENNIDIDFICDSPSSQLSSVSSPIRISPKQHVLPGSSSRKAS